MGGRSREGKRGEGGRMEISYQHSPKRFKPRMRVLLHGKHDNAKDDDAGYEVQKMHEQLCSGVRRARLFMFCGD